MDEKWIRDQIPEIESDTEARAVLQALGLGDAPTTTNTIKPLTSIETLRRVAVREFIRWLAGTRRYDSISALERDRVTSVFAEVRGALPSVRSLADDLSMPEGRAVAMLGRMRYGQANLFEAMRYKRLVKLVDDARTKPTPKKDEKLVFTSEASRELFAALRVMTVDKEAKKQVSQNIRPKSLAQRGLQWTMQPDDWTCFRDWLEERAKKIAAKYRGA